MSMEELKYIRFERPVKSGGKFIVLIPETATEAELKTLVQYVKTIIKIKRIGK